MVDCGSLRCAQERRSLRRDLQSLGKKLPVILGLESIAALYKNSDKKTKITPLAVEENSQPACQDFQPSNRCAYCEKKLPNVHKRINRIIDDARKGKENKGRICLRSLQDLMPFCLDFYTRGFGRELFSDSVKNYFTMTSPDAQEEELKVAASKSLAASQSGGKTGELVVPYHVENNRSHKTKETRQFGECEENEENQAVVGELKERSLSEQMAMMYTTPHSLLNGTHVKSEMESTMWEQPFPCLPTEPASASSFYPLPSPLHLTHPLFMQHPSLSDFPLMRTPMDGFPSPFAHSLPSPDAAADLLRDLHLTHIRRLHNLNGSNASQPPPAHGSQLKLPLLSNVVRKLVYERFQEIKKHHRKRRRDRDEETDDFGPSSLIKKKFSSVDIPHTSSLRDEPVCLSSKRDDDLDFKHQIPHHLHPGHNADSLLKHFGKVNECSRIGDTLKDIIGKSISEKVKLRDCSSDENSNLEKPRGHLGQSLLIRNNVGGREMPGSYRREADLPTSFEKDSSSPPLKRCKKEVTKNRCFSNKSPVEDNSKLIKKTRPKRGQYRKYNSQLLMDAVRAVQRGEMSVHRAGSFFGVPHSTLEYKVKERHLLRQRKAREGSNSGSPPKSEAHESREVPLVTTINLSRDSSPALSETSPLPSKSYNESIASTSSRSPRSPPSSFTSNNNNNQEEKKNPSASACVSGLPPSKLEPLSLSLSPAQASASCPPPFHMGSRSQQDLSWLKPYLPSSSSHSDLSSLAVGFPTAGLALNTSASELLRKLQHKVASKDDLLSCHQLPAIPMPFGNDAHTAFSMAASSKENGNELAETLAVFH